MELPPEKVCLPPLVFFFPLFFSRHQPPRATQGEELAQQYGLADAPHTVAEFGASMRDKGFPVPDQLLLQMCGMSPSDSPARKRSKH